MQVVLYNSENSRGSATTDRVKEKGAQRLDLSGDTGEWDLAHFMPS